MTIRERLYELRDPDYAAFTAKLVPTIPPERVLGVRFPQLRALARELYGTPEAEDFLTRLPHELQEENHLHALLLERRKDFGQCLAEVERFLPYVDNWAVCDTLRPKAFARHKAELLPHVFRWLDSGETYTVRFGLGMLMANFLDDAFEPRLLDRAAALRSDEYYLNMMIAWYFATALAKQDDAALPVLEQGRLDPWTHNKTIRKACESYRVSEEHKAYLKTLRKENG